VLHGLMACHAKGVYHRDVKPANIVVAGDGSVCLVDFGIARIADEYSLTGDSKVLGTPEYLAPELLGGEHAGPSSDLWALGVTLYCALEGHSPFHGASLEATITAVLYKDPPEPRRRGALAGTVLEMLRKKQSARLDAAAVASALRSVLSGGTAARRPYWYGPDGHPPPIRTAQRTMPLAGMPTTDAAEIISGAATDSAVAALLAMEEADAARIINRCPHNVAGKLLGAMAADQPARVGKILDTVPAGRAGRMLDRLSSTDAASILAAMPPTGAVRILREADSLTAVDALPEMPPRSAGAVVMAMDEELAADVLGRVAPANVAAILNLVSGELRNRLQQRFPVDFRNLVRRYL
jgi:eukaryotic-like serine/threonine-protein kinase